VVAGRDADAGRVVLGGGEKGFVEGGVEVFLADETFLADHGRRRDVAVDVGGDVGGHGGELGVDYVVVIFAHGGDEDILNIRKRVLDLSRSSRGLEELVARVLRTNVEVEKCSKS
jgi:hypothetical protein